MMTAIEIPRTARRAALLAVLDAAEKLAAACGHPDIPEPVREAARIAKREAWCALGEYDVPTVQHELCAVCGRRHNAYVPCSRA